MSVSTLAGNVKIMNKTPFEQPSNSEDELLPEYQFDYKSGCSSQIPWSSVLEVIAAGLFLGSR